MSNTKPTAQECRDDIPEVTANLASTLGKEFTVDSSNGNISFTEGYEAAALGEEFTPEQAKAFSERSILLTNASYMAVGVASVDAFKANPELEHVRGSVPIGGMHLDIDISRNSSVRNVKSGEVTEVKNAGHAKLAFKKPTNKTAYKKVRSYLQSLGNEEL